MTISRVGRALRLVWLAVGVALSALFVLEIAYRSQGVLRTTLREWRAPKDLPNPSAPLLAETYATAEKVAWHPYIYFRRKPFAGRYTTIDSLGLRRTIQAVPPSAIRRKIFMFGASPLWGTGLRDSMTIPSRLSAALVAHGVRDVAITNFGEGGVVLTQELIDLILQLRAGERPSVVVFYDGYNDIAAAMNDGRAGHTKGEDERARDFEAGNSLFAWRHDAATEMRAFDELAKIAGSRFLLLQHFAPLRQPEHSSVRVSNDSLVDAVIRNYAGTVEIIRALEKEYGFTAFYAWMPMLDPTQKHMSPFEAQLARQMSDDPWTLRFLALHRMAVARIQPIMRDLAPGRFAELSGLFATDSLTVYIEQGHTTEAASDVIADALALDLLPILAKSEHARSASVVRRPGQSSATQADEARDRLDTGLAHRQY